MISTTKRRLETGRRLESGGQLEPGGQLESGGRLESSGRLEPGRRWRCGPRPLAPRRSRGPAETPHRSTVHGSRQATLRVPLPESLLGRVARSARRGSCSRVWGPLEAALHASVFRWLPAGARDVRLAWDPERLEVVARFHVADGDSEEPGASPEPGA